MKCDFCKEKCNTCRYSGCKVRNNDGGEGWHRCKTTGFSEYIPDGNYCKMCGQLLALPAEPPIKTATLEPDNFKLDAPTPCIIQMINGIPEKGILSAVIPFRDELITPDFINVDEFPGVLVYVAKIGKTQAYIISVNMVWAKEYPNATVIPVGSDFRFILE